MDSLLRVLQATLDPDPNIRLQAELSLGQLTSQSQTALALAQVTTEASLDVAHRQMSRVFPGFALKKYVKEYWSPFFPSFKGPTATTVEIKEQIRKIIFAGLSDPIRKMRLACAVIISDIAHPDWPDDWPSLMSSLLALVGGPASTPDSVDGGMRVLNDFVGIDLTEDQLLPIAKDMLPVLLGILGNPQTHSPSTRARAILIFRQCVMTLFTVKDEHPAAVKAAIGEILPQWHDAFRVLLEIPVERDLEGASWEGLAVRNAIFQALEVILNSFPSTLKTSLPHFLSIASTHLSSIYPTYRAAYLSTNGGIDVPSPVEEDSQVPSDLPTFAATLLDFVGQACYKKALKKTWEQNDAQIMTATLTATMGLAQMTEDDEDSWASDPNAFVADEDDEMVSLTVRSAAVDFVASLIEQYPTTGLSALWSAFLQTAAVADAARSSDEEWWKGYESALALVGAVAGDLIEAQEEGGSMGGFDLEKIFGEVVPAFLGSAELPFLQGRSFVFASQFAKVLPVELANQYIDAAIVVLRTSDASVPVKVSAVRALSNFFRHLKTSVDSSRAVQALVQLLPLLPQTSDNTLVLVVETVESTLKVAGPALDAETCAEVVKQVLTTWFETPGDPILASTIGEVFTSFAASSAPVLQHSLLTSVLPALTQTLTARSDDPHSVIAGASVELLDSIFDGATSPLPPGMFAIVGGELFALMQRTEDRATVQSGLSVVTSVVRKDVDQLLNWTNALGQPGMELILGQVAKLLEPSESEAGGLFVGDLVIHLIRKAGNALGPVLPDLLKAFVTRLATAETSTFSQSLILPFAFLVHQQLDTVLGLLEGITVPAASPGAPPRQAIEVLLASWCDNVDVFQGYWNLKLSTVALTQLFLSARPSLSAVQVKGDLLLTAANSATIMTRAKARKNPDQFPPIPFPAKVLKVLIKEVQNSISDDRAGVAGAGAAGMGEGDDAESDDGDDEWADEGEEFASGDKDLDFLSDLLGAGGSLSKYLNDDDDDDEPGEEDDLDLRDDPIYTLDIKSHLFNFFQQAYSTDVNQFRAVAEQYLTQSEKDVLAYVLSSTSA